MANLTGQWSPQQIARPIPPTEALRPEFAVMQQRFREWQRELAGFSHDHNVDSAFSEPIRHARHIAERIGGELQRFHHGHGPPAEPEDLRRLLGHGQRLTEQLAIRASGLKEVQLIREGLAGACERLLREPTVDDEPVRRLCDLLRDAVASEDHPWVLCDPAFADASATPVVRIGVTASRLTARLARRVGFAKRETIAALYASLFQDCGYLLLQRRHGDRRELAEHPRYGAALAAGLRRTPTEALAAIAGHHADSTGLATGRRSPARRVDYLVSVISRFVESFLLQELPPAECDAAIGLEATAVGFRAEVAAALKAELTRVVVPPAESNGNAESVAVQESGGHVPTPHLVRSFSRAAGRAVPVS